MDTSRRVYVFSLIAVALWCGLILVAPASKLAGFPSQVSSILYTAFSHVCHQFPDRTLFLGSEPLGVCARCTGIYFSFLASMILLPFPGGLREKVPPRAILLIALSPMAIDVFLSISGIHFSTMGTRLLTGILAGGVLPFFVLPPFLDAIRQLMVHRGDSLNAKQTG